MDRSARPDFKIPKRSIPIPCFATEYFFFPLNCGTLLQKGGNKTEEEGWQNENSSVTFVSLFTKIRIIISIKIAETRSTDAKVCFR